MQDIKLSIIMPLYNVETTLKRAIDSILMQQVDFNYEIITVNDASTDSTLDILKEYGSHVEQLRILENKENSGNALSFYNALKECKGDYFTVLDGDDYYTVINKLQKQVDFLNSDYKEEYVAVTHKYLRVLSNGEIVHDHFLFHPTSEYNYVDFLRRRYYSHTSTYMYRNIFKSRVPDFFLTNRGDMPRTFIAQYFSYGRIKALDFVGSVYSYNEDGIWSKLTQAEQIEKNNLMWQKLADYVTTNQEKELFLEQIKSTKDISKSAKPKIKTWSPKEAIDMLRSKAGRAAFSDNNFIFKRLYKSELIDSFCETIGRIALNNLGYSPICKIPQNNRVMITTAYLNKTGGGIYREIMDLIDINSDKEVYLLLTDVADKNGLQDGVAEDLQKFEKFLKIIYCGEFNNDLEKMFKNIIDTNPSCIYHYCGHNNVIAAALIQKGLAKNVSIFSIDHGFSLTLDNSAIDTFIVKTPNQYQLLNKHYPQRVVYVPLWEAPLKLEGSYKPFNNHENLITSTAAARFYKFEGGICEYGDFICKILEQTKGKHIHYGNIPKEKLAEIKQKLADYNISQDDFVHIEWAPCLAQSLYDNNVDIFIAPFPVTSGKILVQLEGAGIPVICYDGDTRIECNDFVSPDALYWRDVDKFLETIKGLDAEKLMQISKKEKEFFDFYNDLNKTKENIKTQTSYLPIPNPSYFYDNRIIDIYEFREFLLNIYNAAPEAMLPPPNMKLRKKNIVYKIYYKYWKHINKHIVNMEEYKKKHKISYKIWKNLDKKLRNKGIIA